MKENNIDCMKYRKSTHLAGVDVETIVDDKGACILTIKEAYYNTGVDVSGNRTKSFRYFNVDDHDTGSMLQFKLVNGKVSSFDVMYNEGC